MATSYVIYETPDGSGMCPIWNVQALKMEKDEYGDGFKIIKTFEASTWNIAMQINYDHFGFGKYHPMVDENGVIIGDEDYGV